MLYLFIHFKFCTKSDNFVMALIQNKDFKFPFEKKQKKAHRKQIHGG